MKNIKNCYRRRDKNMEGWWSQRQQLDAVKLLKETRKLCTHVIAREKKRMNK